MVEYEVLDRQPADEIYKTRLMRKYFDKWLAKTTTKYIKKQYEDMCNRTSIKYLDDHQQEISILGSSLVMIFSQFSLAMTTILTMIYTGLINSNIFYDLITQCIRRGLIIRHFIIQLEKQMKGFQLSNLGNIVPVFSANDEQLKTFDKKCRAIWYQETLRYMRSIKT